MPTRIRVWAVPPGPYRSRPGRVVLAVRHSRGKVDEFVLLELGPHYAEQLGEALTWAAGVVHAAYRDPDLASQYREIEITDPSNPHDSGS